MPRPVGRRPRRKQTSTHMVRDSSAAGRPSSGHGRRSDPLDHYGPAAPWLLAPDYPHLGRPCRPDFLSPSPPPAEPSPTDTARERWDSLIEQHCRLLRGGSTGPGQTPESLRGEELRRLCWTLFCPVHRPLFREVLPDLLADPITDIALAVAQEVQHAA
jgi:hypothetical protein